MEVTPDAEGGSNRPNTGAQETVSKKEPSAPRANGESALTSEGRSNAQAAVTTVLDLIGSLRIITQGEVLIRVVHEDYNFDRVPFGEEIMSVTNKIESPYQVYVLGDVHKAYFRVLFGTIRKFTGYEDFVEALNELYSDMQLKARSILVEPPKQIIGGYSVCNPDYLGFPYSELYDQVNYDRSVIDAHLVGVCGLRQARIPGIFANTFVCEGEAISDLRAVYVRYCATTTPNIIRRMQAFINAVSGVDREMFTFLKSTPYDVLYPTYDFTDGVLAVRYMPFYTRFVYNAVNSLLMPIIKLVPCDVSELLKVAAVNANRASYITQLVNITYDETMNADISAWISSLITPGLVQFEIEWGSTTHFNNAYTGVLALVAKMVLNFSRVDTISNVAEESVRKLENAIVDWGIDKKRDINSKSSIKRSRKTLN